jgi:uncharacterized membrane-anchored protein
MVRKLVLFLGLAIALGIPGAMIVHKERVLAAGTPVLLELASFDPRSLMEGDYMRLNYAIANQLWRQGENWPQSGRIVVKLDEHGVARLVGHWPEVPLGDNRLLAYRKRKGRVRIGPDAFFFQEGEADRYRDARYGELRLDSSGEAILVGLRDAQRNPLGRSLH